MIVVWRTKCSVSVFYMGFSYEKKMWASICSSTFFCLSPASLPIEFCCPSSVCPQILCVDMCDSIENYQQKTVLNSMDKQLIV
jgi:hypothetical protein